MASDTSSATAARLLQKIAFSKLRPLRCITHYGVSEEERDYNFVPFVGLCHAFPSHGALLLKMARLNSGFGSVLVRNLATVDDFATYDVSSGVVGLHNHSAVFYILGKVIRAPQVHLGSRSGLDLLPFAESWERSAAVLGRLLRKRALALRSAGHGVWFCVPHATSPPCFRAQGADFDVHRLAHLPRVGFSDISEGSCVMPLFTVSYSTASSAQMARFNLSGEFDVLVNFNLLAVVFLREADPLAFTPGMFDLTHHALGVTF